MKPFFNPTREPGASHCHLNEAHLLGGLFASVLLLAGCTVGPQYSRPATAAPAAFGNGGGVSISTNAVETTWWGRFQDPLLEELVNLAATNNPDLRIAQSRLREARALWTQARFDFVPTVRNENSYTEQTTSLAAQPTLDRRGRHTEIFRTGLDATWELDLWGHVRRNVEAARATVESVEATRDEVLVVVRAEVAANYLELRGLQGQLAVARRNATNQSVTLRLAEALRDGGQGTQFDVARAKSLLNATLATIPPFEAAVDRARHRIAVLCGQPPVNLASRLSEGVLPKPRYAEVAVGDPAELLRRRPDVRAAERSLAAATARIGVEVAGLFPAVTFVGSVGLQAGSVGSLGDSGSDAWGFGPHISWAALDLGRVRQRIQAADARAQAALGVYEKTVLLALEETENSLVNLGRERQRLEFLRASETAAAEAVDLARQRYRDGVADFLSVLDAERTLLNLQDQIVTSETRSATSLVAVYKALGGGAAAPAK